MHGSPATFNVRECLVRSAMWICEDAGHLGLPPCRDCIQKTSRMLAAFFEGLPQPIKALQPAGLAAAILSAGDVTSPAKSGRSDEDPDRR